MPGRNGKHKHIKGWGSDLDPQNRPAYPKERMPPRLEGVHWDQPAQQVQQVPVFHSIERPGMTPLFGSSVPPSGLSGVIRKQAFKLSENDVRHWLMLLFADRVNVVEGMFADVRRSKATPVVAGAVVGVVVLGVLSWLVRRR